MLTLPHGLQLPEGDDIILRRGGVSYRALAFDDGERIQRQRKKGWRKPEGAISCCRPGRWGNAFRVSSVITLRHTPMGVVSVTITPELAVALYATQQAESGRLETIRSELRGRTLMCFCEIGDPCHADWLCAVANA